MTSPGCVERLIDEGRLAVRREGFQGLGPPPADPVVSADRVEGMLLGLAIGDALGNTSEGLPPAERAARFGEITDYLPHPRAGGRPVGLPSDDTQLAFWTLESLLEHRRGVPEDVIARFAAGEIVGVGRTVAAALRRYRVAGGATLRGQRRGGADRARGGPAPRRALARPLGGRDPGRRCHPQRPDVDRGVRRARRAAPGRARPARPATRRVVARDLHRPRPTARGRPPPGGAASGLGVPGPGLAPGRRPGARGAGVRAFDARGVRHLGLGGIPARDDPVGALHPGAPRGGSRGRAGPGGQRHARQRHRGRDRGRRGRRAARPRGAAGALAGSLLGRTRGDDDGRVFELVAAARALASAGGRESAAQKT